MDHSSMVEMLSQHLGGESPPVALAFVQAPPEGVPRFDGEVPSACTFWRRAEEEVFYAPADKHYNCPIGALTMGFELPEKVSQELMGLVGMMCSCGYLAEEEAARIPSVKKEKSGILYGPLARFPVAPDLVLLWVTPAQAMLCGEATGTSQWTASTPTTVFGRPACAALPIAVDSGQPSLSAGCAGMRTFTEMSDDRMLLAVPGHQLQGFATALGSTAVANQAMLEFYRDHKERFTTA